MKFFSWEDPVDLEKYAGMSAAEIAKAQRRVHGGLDLYEGVVRDNKKAGVFEPAISKIKSLKFATEAAITILRIDDMIKLAPEKGQEKSYQQAYADGSLNG